MLRNYLKVALRNLFRHKSYSFINIMGLAIGMSCCILILLYVRKELSYDRYHENADHIYRVTREWFNEDGTSNLHLGHVAPPAGPLLINDFPDIIESVRLLSGSSMLTSYEEKHFLEERVFFAEENLFRVFSFKLLRGDPDTVLKDPFTVILTPAAALKYFGEEDPMGKILKFENRIQAKVSGIVEPAPENSHFHFDFIGSFATLKQLYGARELENWSSNNYATYLLMPENYPIRALRDQLPAFLDRHLGENAHLRNRLHLQRLTDIHLHSHLDSEIEPNSDIVFIYIFSAIATFILLIACINFMNLSTARSSLRSREVGMRKVVGADRNRLIRQFLGESLLLAGVSLGIAVVLVLLALPSFSRFVGRSFSFSPAKDPGFFLTILGMTILTGILAGSYPALFLSSFRPLNALKESRGGAEKGRSFRTILVVFQFAASIILIITLGIVTQQLRYVRGKQLGFNKERIVSLPTDPQMRGKYDSIREQLMAHPGVVNVAASRRIPSGRLLDSSGAQMISGDTSSPVNFRIAFVCVDEAFIDTYQMEIAAGRNFSKQFPTDSKEAFILNERAVKDLGLIPEDAVGQAFQYGRIKGRIIGVVKDFHFESLHQPISPIVFFIRPSDYRLISVRIRPENIPETMEFLKRNWAQWRPNFPFIYSFVDENFDNLYKSEEKLGAVFGIFAALAVLIACLGLFGLASFTAERRIKELGIRKILGASIPGLVLLMIKDFTRWVLAANLVAWPAAYFIINRWLKNFAYRVSPHAGIFIAAGLAALLISILTISYQAVKAASGDPVTALRYE